MSSVDIRLDISGSLTDDLLELERDLPRKVLRHIAREVLPPLDRKFSRVVRFYPPPRTPSSPRFVWSRDPVKNAHARRWFHANYPNGYERTGALGKAWETDIYLDADTVVIEASNESRGASYVYGSETFDQIPGHKTTGWPLIADALVDIGAEVEHDIEDAIYELFDTYI